MKPRVIKEDSQPEPAYLAPYARAARRHANGFASLLWASRRTQALRFEALCRLRSMKGCSILDVGCGRADLLEFLIGRKEAPARYVGLEGIGGLARAAAGRNLPGCAIIEGDFVADPKRMFVGAEVIVFSGSLNTLSKPQFYRTLERAYEAAGAAVVFNYLCSDELAGTRYLNWHKPAEVMAFARSLSGSVRKIEGYISGDCGVSMEKPAAG
jgi:hypothetical protein